MDELLEGWRAIKIYNRSSAIQTASTGAVEYHRNIWTVPKKKCGPLTIFKTVEAVKFFVNGLPAKDYPHLQLTIIKCIHKPSDLQSVWYWLQGSETLLYLLEEVNKSTILPNSIALADAIMPLE